MNKIKCKRSALITMANVVAILLAVRGMVVDRPASASTLCRGAITRTNEATGQAEAFRDSYQISGAASAVSTVTDAAAEGDWPMAAANPQRTSWSPEEVRGQLQPLWFKPFEPYIPNRVQIIAANDLLYTSTARGLYAMDAETGDVVWVYPTELPLGHSPTIHDGVAYVGGLDKRLYAIDAFSGEYLWAFAANQGFYTNPLVVEGKVYAGNRDGYFYAVHAKDPNQGQLVWKYKTDGPILFSAAYQDGVVYFASNDAHAYALNAQTGELVWKSDKLPGAGFHSWWPVVYQDPENGADVVIFSGSSLYRRGVDPGPHKGIDFLDRDDIWPDHLDTPRGTPVGPRTEDGWIDATRVTQYFEEKPWRRTYFILDRATGQEHTFDIDGDGNSDYAPILYHGAQNGNRFPPVVGSDGILYQANNYMSAPWIAGGQVSGWQFGTPFISTPSSRWIAIDEPMAYSVGGNLIYWSHLGRCSAGAFDLSVPNTRFWDDGNPGSDPTREWTYWSYNLDQLIPGYNVRYGLDGKAFGGRNGVYGYNGDQNPPIPYQGKLYIHGANSVIALGSQQVEPIALPMAATVKVEDADIPIPSVAQLKEKLAAEVQKIVETGHLRPGYMGSGLFDGTAHHRCGDNLSDYWHNPSDTLYTLIRALPHLPEELQQETKDYLQNELALYPPYGVVHVGWRDGTSREAFTLPPEVETDLVNHPPTVWSSYGFEGWGGMDTSVKFPPYMFYTLWKYTEIFGGAQEIFDNSKDRLEPVPSDEILAEYPFVHNAYISGYLGYLELEKLAGYTESSNIRAELDRLLDLRVTAFSKDTLYEGGDSCQNLSVARNFMFLVPELGQYLYDNALEVVQEAVDEYSDVAPYWFVSKFEATIAEGTIHPLYDYNALFQAKALILRQPREELVRYLDVPAFERGDLFYIQNLVAAIEAPLGLDLEKTANPISGGQGTVITYTLIFFGSGSTLTLTDTLPSGVSAPGSFELEGTSVTPTYDSDQHRLTWSDTLSASQEVTIGYTVVITTSEHLILVNTAELSGAGGEHSTAMAIIIANPYLIYLPLILN